jgi:hypothetical protein
VAWVALALEARAVNAQMLRIKSAPIGKGGSLFFWSPTMNLGRDPRQAPCCSSALCTCVTVCGLLSSWHEQFVCVLVCRWGRFQESISEDPWLLGAYSSTFLTTFQAADSSGTPATISSCKHLVAYSLEGGDSADDNFTRHTFNAVVSAQDLSESYLPGFHQCITKGKPGQVMCSCEECPPRPSLSVPSSQTLSCVDPCHTCSDRCFAGGHLQTMRSTGCRRNFCLALSIVFRVFRLSPSLHNLLPPQMRAVRPAQRHIARHVGVPRLCGQRSGEGAD